MKIERRKIEKVGEFSSKTKARLVALLGVSAAFSISACASAQQKEETSPPPHEKDVIEEPLAGDVLAPDPEFNDSLKTISSSSSEPQMEVFEPLGGIVYIPDSTDMDSSKAGSSETSTLDLDEL